MIGLTRLRGGALSPIRNQRLLFEANSSVEIRVFSLTLWGYIPTGRESGLKIHPVRVRIPLPLPHGTIHIYFLSWQSGKTLDGKDRLAQWVDGVWSLTWLQTKGSVGSIPAQPLYRATTLVCGFVSRTTQPTISSRDIGEQRKGSAAVSKIVVSGFEPHLPRHKDAYSKIFK